MATLRNKLKLPAVSGEAEERTRNCQSQIKFVPEITQDYITQVSEEMEAIVTKNLTQETSRTQSCILGILFKLYDFFVTPQTRTLSGTVPETSQNNDVQSRDLFVDRSRSEPHHELEFSTRRISYLVDSDQ